MFAGGTGGDEHGIGMFSDGAVKMSTGGAAAGEISVGGVMFTGGAMRYALEAETDVAMRHERLRKDGQCALCAMCQTMC